MRIPASTQTTEGFTLIELMLVVTLLAIIIAVAVPSLLGAKKSANEGAAIVALRSLTSAQLQYRVRFRFYGSVTNLEQAGSLDDSWRDMRRNGYTFTSVVPLGGIFWYATATPEIQGITGDRHFYVDETGIIRHRQSAPATSSDPAIH
jgi:prepilin-type N-terminal cleavage/methylation domain-containing protein